MQSRFVDKYPISFSLFLWHFYNFRYASTTPRKREREGQRVGALKTHKKKPKENNKPIPKPRQSEQMTFTTDTRLVGVKIGIRIGIGVGIRGVEPIQSRSARPGN